MTPDLSAFGDVRLVRPLPGGHRNTVWLVETSAGLAVAKSTAHSADALAWLAPLHAAARTAGFVVPAFHRTGAGAILSEGWTVEDWQDGPALTPADLPTLAPRLRALHAQASALPQRPGQHSLPDRACLPLPHLPAAVARLCRAALMPIADHPTTAIHGDINPSNLIHTGSNGPALIDWDEARRDLPFLDFIQIAATTQTEIRAHLACEIISGWAVEPAYAQACADRLAHL
jgi:Phosphotransferase enzyme family